MEKIKHLQCTNILETKEELSLYIQDRWKTIYSIQIQQVRQ